MINAAMQSDWIETPDLELPCGAITPLQQHPTYGAACSSLGARARFMVLRGPQGGAARGAVQVLLRRWPLLGEAALVSRGPVWAPDVAPDVQRAGLHALLEQLRAGFRVVSVTPECCAGEDPMDGSGWLTSVTPCFLARLDLAKPLDQLRAELHRKWRYRLGLSERSDLRLRHVPMPADPGHWLLQAEARQSRARGYRNLPAAFVPAWVRAGGPGAARLFVANLGGAPVAGMVFLLHGQGASYHIAWTGPDGRRTDAHRRLLWSAIEWLQTRGVKTLDLDRFDTEITPDLARFKLGTGAQAVQLGATRISAPFSRLFAERKKPTPKPARGGAACA